MDTLTLNLSRFSGAAAHAGPYLDSNRAASPADPGPAPQALVAQLGGEVARSLSSALERVSALAADGHIDRAGLRALREEIDLARRAGIMAQQWARLCEPDLQLAQERVDLAALLREAVTLRQRASKAHDIQVKQTYTEVNWVSDGALVFSLVETLLDWAFEHARSRLVLRLDAKLSPNRARLACAFLRRHPAPAWADGGDGPDESLSTLSWRLLQRIAAVLGLQLTRRDTGDRSEMRLVLPGVEARAVAMAMGADSAVDSAQVWQEHALTGRHVVALCARREMRGLVRDALRPTGAMMDFVATLDEARQLFEDALPHAVIYEAALGGEPFDRLRDSLLAEAPALAFIQIAPGHRAFEVLEIEGRPHASVGEEAWLESLPVALLFELSRG